MISARVVWLGDDIFFAFNLAVSDWLDKVDTFGEIIESQAYYYMNRNGRFVTHCVVQFFSGFAGQMPFALLNAAMWVAFLLVLARLTGVNWRQSPRGVLVPGARQFCQVGNLVIVAHYPRGNGLFPACHLSAHGPGAAGHAPRVAVAALSARGLLVQCHVLHDGVQHDREGVLQSATVWHRGRLHYSSREIAEALSVDRCCMGQESGCGPARGPAVATRYDLRYPVREIEDSRVDINIIRDTHYNAVVWRQNGVFTNCIDANIQNPLTQNHAKPQ